jgi:hypothetical protein
MSRSGAAVAGGLALAALIAALPGPGRRLAEIPGDGPDPVYDAPLPAERIREVGRRLKAAGQLFFAPALPVQDERLARWDVVYRNGTFFLLPRG